MRPHNTKSGTVPTRSPCPRWWNQDKSRYVRHPNRPSMRDTSVLLDKSKRCTISRGLADLISLLSRNTFSNEQIREPRRYYRHDVPGSIFGTCVTKTEYYVLLDARTWSQLFLPYVIERIHLSSLVPHSSLPCVA